MGSELSCSDGGDTRNTCEKEWNDGGSISDDSSVSERGPCLWVGGDVPCIDIENKNDCSVFKEKDLCEERPQCNWDNASCRQNSKCADFRDQELCPDTCTWRNKCIAPCETRDNKSCTDDECIWENTCRPACKFRETEGDCSYEHSSCVWDSSSCRQKSKCADFSDQSSCPNRCEWDGTANKCKERENCRSRNENNCHGGDGEFLCSWDVVKKECVEGQLLCNYPKSECNLDNSCIWRIENKVGHCYLKECSERNGELDCNKGVLCRWDGDKCVMNNCSDINEQDECDKYELCRWDNTTTACVMKDLGERLADVEITR